jgi:hypothetical protein
VCCQLLLLLMLWQLVMWVLLLLWWGLFGAFSVGLCRAGSEDISDSLGGLVLVADQLDAGPNLQQNRKKLFLKSDNIRVQPFSKVKQKFPVILTAVVNWTSTMQLRKHFRTSSFANFLFFEGLQVLLWYFIFNFLPVPWNCYIHVQFPKPLSVTLFRFIYFHPENATEKPVVKPKKFNTVSNLWHVYIFGFFLHPMRAWRFRESRSMTEKRNF